MATDNRKEMEKIKRLLIALLCFLFAFLLTSCKKIEETFSDRFLLIDRCSSCEIYVDKHTGVEYVSVYGDIEMLVDSYGNPLLYPAFDAREDKLP